jgi:hypothetical protein
MVALESKPASFYPNWFKIAVYFYQAVCRGEFRAPFFMAIHKTHVRVVTGLRKSVLKPAKTRSKGALGSTAARHVRLNMAAKSR